MNIMYRLGFLHVLTMRTLLALVMLVVAGYFTYYYGFVDKVIEHESSRISWLILALFALGMLDVLRKLFEAGWALDALDTRMDTKMLRDYRSVQKSGPRRAAQVFEMKLSKNRDVVLWVENLLPKLGYFGTVYGIIIALSGVKPEAASDVSFIAPMVAILIEGAFIAMWTTLVGLATSMVLSVFRRMLDSAYSNLAQRALHVS